MRLLPIMVLGLVVSAVTVAFAVPDERNINSLFNEACDLYEAGELEGALQILRSLASDGVRDPAVYYNLGNCYYRQGEIGRAVISYRRAHMLAPRDEDIEANLAFLRSSVGFRDTTGSFDLAALAGIPGETASPKEWKFAFYAFYYLGVLSFLLVLFFRGDFRRQALRAFAVLVVLAIACWVFADRGVARFASGTEGVVVADRSEFMSGPGSAFDELARLPDGVEVELRARSGIWVEVQLPTGEIGWLREQNVETI